MELRWLTASEVDAVAVRAREHGCYGVWVLTDHDNAAAIGAYQRAGGQNPTIQTMVEWRF